MLRGDLEELCILYTTLLLTVVLLNAALDLLKAFGAELLELTLEVLDLPPAFLLLLEVLFDETFAFVLCKKGRGFGAF